MKFFGKLFVFVILCFSNITCKNESKGDNNSIGTELPSDIAMYAFGITEIWDYKQYDFCLLYLYHSPFNISYVFELYSKEGKVYTYTKYMNNVVSAMYPPVYYENIDSIYYNVTFKEYDANVKEDFISKIQNSNFYEIVSPEIKFEDSHDSRWLVVFNKDKGIHSVYNWKMNNELERVLIAYIKDRYMHFSKPLEKSMYIEAPPFEQHIPPNKYIP